MKYDLDALKASADLLAVVTAETDVKYESGPRAAPTSYAGPCPFCGGTDRFVVKPQDEPAWWHCRKCTPGGGTVLDFVMRRDGCSLPEAAEALAEREGLRVMSAEELAAQQKRLHRRRAAARMREAAHRRQARAHLTAAHAESDLWARLEQHDDVLRRLEREGLPRHAAEHFGLGWDEWSDGRLTLPALVIPYRFTGDAGESVTRAIQYRLLVPEAPGGRYRWEKGSDASGALFNEDALRRPDDSRLVVVEGAKKAASVWGAGLTSVVGVVNSHGWMTLMNGHRGAEIREMTQAFDSIVFALDPDARVDAIESAGTLTNSRVARLPMKVDDLLALSGGDADLLASYVELARPIG